MKEGVIWFEEISRLFGMGFEAGENKSKLFRWSRLLVPA